MTETLSHPSAAPEASCGFFESEPGCYRITQRNLPSAWDYIYKNDRLLVFFDQHGPVKAQIDPPGGIVLFRREAQDTTPPWLIWIASPQFKHGAFTNFFKPRSADENPAVEPPLYNVRFAPYEASYTLEHQGVRAVTTFTLHPDHPALLMRFCLENITQQDLNIDLMPVIRLYANPAQLAPWDQPEWYLKTSFFRHQAFGFLTQLMNMNAQPDQRRYIAAMTDDPAIAGSEIFYEKFVGHGRFDRPQAVYENRLRLSPEQASAFGVLNDQNTACCFGQINAVHYPWTLKPGQKKTLSQVISLLPNGPEGTLPSLSDLAAAVQMTEAPQYDRCRQKLKDRYERLIALRGIQTGRADFDRYVNHWLPLQQDWICSLDRGWPSGMRGSRDSANDFTAMAPLYPAATARAILLLCECQRSDGWFPRQYSAAGRKGRHDLRGHVDAGCWVIELLHEYLCWTKDFGLLTRTAPWLDSDSDDSLLEHARKAADFFIAPENLGEHGLCKIGEGDWNDAVNLAGLRGRGESVMVSCQTVIALTQLCQLLRRLQTLDIQTRLNLTALVTHYEDARQSLIDNLRRHAFNAQGYFSAVFNDDGRWIFSPDDPDGQRRISGPANWYAIASGAADESMTRSILSHLDTLKCQEGYRLFYPPFGARPIPTVGRIATGDQPAGVFENGTAYNQGSHGFLSRALAAAGQADLLYNVIGYMLPYDQAVHPVSRTLTAPYAVVNTWLLAPGYEGRGGRTFLTGTISMALRAVYSWMLGIQPTLTGLLIDPCMPSQLKHTAAHFHYCGKRFDVTILNGGQKNLSVCLDGTPVENRVIHPFSRREAIEIDHALLCGTAACQLQIRV